MSDGHGRKSTSSPHPPHHQGSFSGSSKSPHVPSGASSSTAHRPSNSNPNRPDIILSQTKVRAIMKSSPEVEHVGNDALYLITKSTELFIEYMANESLKGQKGSQMLEYKNLSDLVLREESLEFLKEIIPAKMTARQALHEVAKQKGVLNKELFS